MGKRQIHKILRLAHLSEKYRLLARLDIQIPSDFIEDYICNTEKIRALIFPQR